VVAIAAWMLDPIACAGMAVGAPRVAVSALTDLHHLLIERGFRGSSVVDSQIVKEEQNEPFAKVGSANDGAEQNLSSTQPRAKFHPTSVNDPDGADEGDRQLGVPFDASGGRLDGGAHR
jgi:hypothetical protein